MPWYRPPISFQAVTRPTVWRIGPTTGGDEADIAIVGIIDLLAVAVGEGVT